MPAVSSDVNDRDEEERTDPHIVAPKSPQPAASPPRVSSIPQRPMPAPLGALAQRTPLRTSEPGARMSDPARPPILPVRPSATAAAPAASPSPVAAPAPVATMDRSSDMPPTSSLTAAMLIPRPSTVSPPPSGRVSDPGGGDPLRERLAQVEVQSAATRSIASRVEAEANRANTRLDALDPRVGALETSVRDRTAQLEATIEATKRSLEARVEDMASIGARPTAPMLMDEGVELGPLKSAVATMRHTLAEHERLFEARRARVDSLETRVASVESDPRLVELRRATESFDLRLIAIERAQESLRADIDARLAAMEARLAEAPRTGTSKKLAAGPEPELRRIKGVGPKYEKALNEVGITTLAQVAAMSDDDLGRVAAQLSVPVERVRKLGWPEIARGLLSE